MPQAPLLADVIQIEPGSGDTLTVSRDAGTGGLKLVDAVLPGGVLLSALVGLRTVTGVYIVGRAGDGAPYTSIQDALDAVPDTSSALLPSLVWVLPGVYTENLTIQKDGVYLASPGGAVLKNSGASDTVTISASIDNTPLKVLLRGLEITNDQAGLACLKLTGADSFASCEVTVVSAPLAAGDTLTISGVDLTGVAANRTSGSNNFSTLGGTVAAVAAEIAAALNDSLNSFAVDYEATVIGAVITVKARVAGSAANAVTVETTTTPAGGITLSGDTLSGGGADGTLVLSQGLRVEDCLLKATGVGSYQIYADTVGWVDIQGGSWRESSSSSQVLAQNCAVLRILSVDYLNEIALSYDTGEDRPADQTSEYRISECPRVSTVIANLVGEGSLTLHGCAGVGDVTVGGDRDLIVWGSRIGTLTLSDTVRASLSHTYRGTPVLAGGAPTLQETSSQGTQDFVASSSEEVPFVLLQPDTSYRVFLDSPDPTVVLAVTNKGTDSFEVSSSVVFTGTVGYLVSRDI